VLLGAQTEIWLEARVALLVGPECEGNRGQIMKERDGMSVFRQVDRGEKENLAGVAGFEADVGQLLGLHTTGELAFGPSPACGAMNPAEFPSGRRERTGRKRFR